MSKIITKIEVGKKNNSRVNIFIDEDFAFSCSNDLVYYYKLEKGKTVDLNLLKDIVDEDNYINGKNHALKIIERSYKSQKEMIEKLLLKGYQENIIARIIDFLKEYSFLNDKKYTEMFIKDKSLTIGRNKIKYMLQRKGIEDKIIEDELMILEEGFEKEVALNLAEKKLHILKKSESNSRKIYKKMGDYLLSKGYNFDIITSTLNKVIDIEEYDKIHKNNSIDEFVNEKEDRVSEGNLNKLKEIAEKRYTQLCKLEKDKTKIYRKLSEFLIRRGYTFQDTKKILKEIVENE